MSTRPPLALLLAVCVAATVPWQAGARLSPVVGEAAAAEEAPALLGQAVRTALFDAQAALLVDDRPGAAAAVDTAATAAADLLPLFAAQPAAAENARRALADSRTAADAGDRIGLAMASGQVWASLLHGAYAETIRAVERGDADAAAAWLLLRDFRPPTRFARPGTDATLAVQALGRQEIDRKTAATAVRADLLDTYQARLEAALDGAAGDPGAPQSPSRAEAIGLVAGWWPMLSTAHREQLGAAAGVEAAAVFASLPKAIRAADAAALAEAAAAGTTIVQAFRAAPLSDNEQARRAGQLLRYLSLVPVEYGRGVTQGQVTLAFEIQEARAFLDGAKAAFADLRLPLRERDATATDAAEGLLRRLDVSIDEALAGTAVADPGTVEADANAATTELQAIFPEMWSRPGGDADFDVVNSLLDQMEGAAAAGQHGLAESARLEAYAIFETGPEKRLLAFAPDQAQRIERLFWEGEGDVRGLQALLAEEAGVREVGASRKALEEALVSAQAQLGEGAAPAAIVFNAATIVFREGLEAILILASLLASMVGANRVYKKPLAIGAVAALGVTVILFILARNALQLLGQYGEKLEAVVSVVAVGVLLLVMNWFFHKVYWTRWIAKHHDQRRRLLIGGVMGQSAGLVLLGFSSVFREGAETVLFLQALILDAGTWTVVQGTTLGLAATAVVGVLTLVLQAKLPHRKMLIVTGLMIAAVLVTMVGSTVQTLQVVGWAPITPIPALAGLPYWLGVWFGIFPTWQGILAQVAAVVFVIGSYVLAERVRRRPQPSALEREPNRSASRSAPAVGGAEPIGQRSSRTAPIADAT